MSLITPTFDPGPVRAPGLWADLVNVLATPLRADDSVQMMATLQLVLLIALGSQFCGAQQQGLVSFTFRK